MRIKVLVKPQAKQDKIEKTDLTNYAAWVKAKAQEGKANQAVIKLLSAHFNLAKSKIVLIKGKKSKHKVFDLKE